MSKEITNNSISNSSSTCDRILWLDLLRGIGIILMVYGHINYIVPVYNWIYSFHMPLFFFAAGVVYKERPFFKDLLHRARTILIPYVVLGVITLMYWQFAERHYKPSDLAFKDAVKGLFIGSEDSLEFNIPLWFLTCFFLTLVLYNSVRALVLLLCKNASLQVRQFISLIVCIGLSVVYAIDILPVLPWGIDRIPKYIMFVVLGEIAGKILPHDTTNTTKSTGHASEIDPYFAVSPKKILAMFTRVIALVCAIIFLFASIKLSDKLSYNDTRYQWFIVSIVGCAFVVSLSLAIAHCKILAFCGRASLIILCIHGTVYRALTYALSHLTDRTIEDIRTTPILIVTLTIITIALCLLVRQIYTLTFHKKH